ncbi:MAG: hypothetical protein JW769_00555 [Parachlamydiales bacterium]|nr:hypothetical protein [Parachlamydiales bacterium]
MTVDSSSGVMLSYHEFKGGEFSSDSCWIQKRTEEGFSLEKREVEWHIYAIYVQGFLQKCSYFSREGEEERLTCEAHREGKYLYFTRYGEENQRGKLEVSTKPWVQFFEFDLYPFLESDATSFFSFNPHGGAAIGCKIYHLVAIREEIERLEGISESAEKIKITLENRLFRKFWSAYAWLDTSSHRMVRYEGKEAPWKPIQERRLFFEDVLRETN